MSTPTDTDPETNRVGDLRAARLRNAVDGNGGAQAVSRKSGVPLSTLNGYLAGGDIKSVNLVRLADACAVTLDWLAAGRGPRSAELAVTSVSGLDRRRLGAAIRIAEADISQKLGGNATWEERALLVALAYDELTKQAAGSAADNDQAGDGDPPAGPA